MGRCSLEGAYVNDEERWRRVAEGREMSLIRATRAIQFRPDLVIQTGFENDVIVDYT